MITLEPKASILRLGKLFTLGLVLSTATQLRIKGLGLGPGDVVLALSVIFSFFLLRHAHPVSYQFRRFWAWSFLFASLGTVIGVTSRVFQTEFLREPLVWGLCLATTWYGAQLINQCGIERVITYYLAWTLLFTLLLLGIGAATPLGLGPIKPWYQGARFTGWSENPNQLGFWLAATPFLAAYLLTITRSNLTRTIAMLSFLASIVMGAISLSDALFIGWASGGLILGAFALKQFPKLFNLGKNRALTSWLTIFSFAIVLSMILPQLSEVIGNKAHKVLFENAETADRLSRWGYAIQALWGSPAFGYGWGSFSGPYYPFAGEEAHNTWLDWVLSTGLAGLVLLLRFQFQIVKGLIARANLWLLAGVASYFGVMFFHYVLRHPIFWFFITIALMQAHSKDAPESTD